MITAAPSPSTADRVPASHAARSQRDLDPALSLPPASGGMADAAGGIADARGIVDPAGNPGMPTTQAPASDGEGLAPLFQPLEAQGFRDAWDLVQVGFVDDPRRAVHQADELVTQVMQSLGQSFAGERARLEGEARPAQASTEDLRVALRRYRSFLQRLLAF
jgi:hypothetical protein